MSAEIAAQLHPPRLPEAFTATGLPEYLLAMGLGLLLACLIYALLVPFARGKPKAVPVQQRIKAALALPPETALLHLAQVAKDQGLALTKAEHAALYTKPEPSMIADLASRLTAKRGRR